MISIWYDISVFTHFFWSMSSASFVEDFQIISSYTGLVHRRLIMKLPPAAHERRCVQLVDVCILTCCFSVLLCIYIHILFTYVQFMTPVVLNKKKVSFLNFPSQFKVYIYLVWIKLSSKRVTSNLGPLTFSMISLQVPRSRPLPYSKRYTFYRIAWTNRFLLTSAKHDANLHCGNFLFATSTWLLSSDSNESFCTEKSLGNHHFSFKNHGQHHSGSVLYLGCQEQKCIWIGRVFSWAFSYWKKPKSAMIFHGFNKKLHKDLPSWERTCPHPRYVWRYYLQKRWDMLGVCSFFFGG